MSDVTQHQHEVARLIDDFREANPAWRSFSDLARRAGELGAPITRQNLYRIYSEPIASFTRGHVAAIAASLQLPTEVVLRAFLRSMDLPTLEYGLSGVEAAIRADTRLSSDDKENLLALLLAMRKRRAD
jgi:hypothetical protein